MNDNAQITTLSLDLLILVGLALQNTLVITSGCMLLFFYVLTHSRKERDNYGK